jgi:hypothetical protein
MCKLEDAVDDTPLVEVMQYIERGDKAEYDKLIEKSLSPEIVNSKLVCFTAWNFNVERTIYSRANSHEVIEGWRLLLNENIPVDIYTKAFYVTSLHTWLFHNITKDIQVDDKISINNVLEPVSLEILRLCYWINKSKQIIADKESFQTKLHEIKDSLRFQDETRFKEQLNHKLVTFGKILQDQRIPEWRRKLYENELSADLELGPFRSKISSLVSEFMLASLAQEAGFDTGFIPTVTGAKTSDLNICSYKTEVKTFLDDFNEGVKIEDTLIQEIEGTLKREKAKDDITDSLSKKAEIIFMFLTYSSLANGFAKYTFKKDIDFTVPKSLDKAIRLAEQNTNKSIINHIPVVTFTTLIDAVNCDYKVFSFMIPYPVKKINNEYEPDADEFKI